MRHREHYVYLNVGKRKDLEPGETYTIQVAAVTRFAGGKTEIQFRVLNEKQEGPQESAQKGA